ncbi:A-type potassium channel modulatory protein KCNIP1 isoform X1 [Dermatophagoides farinae]|uniref:A-type potassium channel modulatory protein KCNIP1 isoform X1 n=1 Tax=Dermatophagoides farinae TaxID=6954 RepID=UPI003F603F0F
MTANQQIERINNNNNNSQKETIEINDENGDNNDQNNVNFNVWNVFHRVKQLKKKKKRKNSWDSIKDSEFDDLDAPNVHFRPEALETLCQLTKFTRKELQMIYRGFKQEAPSGVVREDSFKHIYSQFFPKGADVNQYAHYVFNTFDPERTGIVTFTDFVIGLSVLSRGTIQDKLKWIFSLYDVNCDGVISKDDLSRVIISVYDLLGKSVQPQVDESTYKQHIDRVFKKLDLNNDGIVTYEIFVEACKKDDDLLQSFDVFNTLL